VEGPGYGLTFDPEERIDLLLRHLGTRREGLSEREVTRRLEQHGPNEIRRREGPGRLREFARQFTHPLALLLWATAVLAVVGGTATLGAAIVAVIVLNAMFAFSQELRRALVVEDDPSIARLLQLELEHRLYEVRCAYDGPSVLKQAESYRPDVIVLDIMLPGQPDGVGVLKDLRRRGRMVPVLMLAARDATMDKVHTLDLGADDYLTKPFEVEELLARLRALVRRTGGDEMLEVGDVEAGYLRVLEWYPGQPPHQPSPIEG
jgi:CheY-like chemotaxis protein